MWLIAAAFFMQIVSTQGEASTKTSYKKYKHPVFCIKQKELMHQSSRNKLQVLLIRNNHESLTINFSLPARQSCTVINFQNVGS